MGRARAQAERVAPPAQPALLHKGTRGGLCFSGWVRSQITRHRKEMTAAWRRGCRLQRASLREPVCSWKGDWSLDEGPGASLGVAGWRRRAPAAAASWTSRGPRRVTGPRARSATTAESGPSRPAQTPRAVPRTEASSSPPPCAPGLPRRRLATPSPWSGPHLCPGLDSCWVTPAGQAQLDPVPGRSVPAGAWKAKDTLRIKQPACWGY